MMEMEDTATLLMHCYNFQFVFPNTMKRIRDDIISTLKIEGASEDYLRRVDKVAIYKSWFGSKLVAMSSRLKEMKVLSEGT